MDHENNYDELPESDVLNSADLFTLLSSPSLVKMEMVGVIRLTERLMEQIATRYGFPNLKQILCVLCPFVTKEMINNLLTLSSSPLKVLRLY